MRSTVFAAAILLSLGCARLMGSTSAGEQIAGCRPPDETSQRILGYMRGVASMNVPARDSMQLSGLDTTRIVIETDRATCIRVAQVVDSTFQHDAAVGEYVIVRAGPIFAAYLSRTAPNGTAGQLLHLVSAAFEYRRAIVGF